MEVFKTIIWQVLQHSIFVIGCVFLALNVISTIQVFREQVRILRQETVHDWKSSYFKRCIESCIIAFVYIILSFIFLAAWVYIDFAICL